MDVKINKIVNLFEKKLFKEALTEIEIFFQEKSFLNEDSNKSAIISTNTRILAGVCSAGLSTIQLPAASAGANFHAAINKGKFHGMI